MIILSNTCIYYEIHAYTCKYEQAHRHNRGLVAPKAIDQLKENGPEQMSIRISPFSSSDESVVLGKPGEVNFVYLAVD
jgi:hypothetical protein